MTYQSRHFIAGVLLPLCGCTQTAPAYPIFESTLIICMVIAAASGFLVGVVIGCYAR